MLTSFTSPSILLPYSHFHDSLAMSPNATYASTHTHPSHIDIPPASGDPQVAEDDLVITPDDGYTPSAAKPPPARGILKNPLSDSIEPNGERMVGEQ